jgi:hypothetical protein
MAFVDNNFMNVVINLNLGDKVIYTINNTFRRCVSTLNLIFKQKSAQFAQNLSTAGLIAFIVKYESKNFNRKLYFMHTFSYNKIFSAKGGSKMVMKFFV